MHTNAPIGCQENYRKMKKEKTPKIQISDLHNFTTNGAKHNYSTQPSRLLQDSKLYFPFLPPSFLSNQTEANSAKIHHTTPKLHKYLKISEMQQRSLDAKTPPPIQHQMQLRMELRSGQVWNRNCSKSRVARVSQLAKKTWSFRG